jgi:hypothetical protein
LSTGDAVIYGSPTRSRRSVATPPPTILSDADVDQTQRHGSLSPTAKAKIAALQARVEQLQAENGSLRYSTRHCSSVPDLQAAIAAARQRLQQVRSRVGRNTAAAPAAAGAAAAVD